jgi:hypothetical protein
MYFFSSKTGMDYFQRFYGQIKRIDYSVVICVKPVVTRQKRVAQRQKAEENRPNTASCHA